MKSLQEISDQIGALPVERRTALNSPFGIVTITQPGSYYLTGNVYALAIQAGDVTVDLNGYTVNHTNNSVAVLINPVSGGPIRNIRLHNGRINGAGAAASGANLWDIAFSGSVGAGISVSASVQGLILNDLAIRGFSTGINAPADAANHANGARLIISNVMVRECVNGITAHYAVIENTQVHFCSSTGISAYSSTLRGVVVDRVSWVGVSGQYLSGSDITVRHTGSAGLSVGHSSFSGVSVSAAADGISGDHNSLSRVVCSGNRGWGINGGHITLDGGVLHGNASGGMVGQRGVVQNSVARANTGRGFDGDHTNYTNVTATGNTSDGIRGNGLTIDGGIAGNNGGHGVLAFESTVRGVSAQYNTGAGVYADNASIVGCMARSNGDDGIRGVGSVIADCRALGNDTNVGGYLAQGIVWSNGRISNSLADTAAPAIP
jgi:hypothetical protein